MKTVSILVPTYNEQENIELLYEEIIKVFGEKLPNYRYEIVFIDNYSNDNSRLIIRNLCKKDKQVKAIFNSKNFGPLNSPYYGLLQTTGDCTILLCADFQDPVSMIVDFDKRVGKWYNVVLVLRLRVKRIS